LNIQGGLTGLFIGPPGTGKSHLLGTISEVDDIENPMLLAPKPREVNSAKYREHEIASEIFKDHRWQPALGLYEIGAFKRLYTRVMDLYEDEDHDVVLLDPFTDVVTLAAHELLMAEKAESPRDLRDSIAFYGALKYKLKGFTQALVGLASPDLPRPKHVFATAHAQPTTEEDIKGKATAEGQAKGIGFLGEVLPMIEGAYRRDIAAEFDIVGFTSLAYENVRDGKKLVREAKFVVQLNADPARHAKVAIVPRLKEKTIPNSMVDLFRVIEEAGG